MTSRVWAISLVCVFGLMVGVASATQKNPANRGRTASGKADATEPADAKEAPKTSPHYEKATFGAGCFWHVEAAFERLPGVHSAVSGYAGGNVPYPTYEMVHEGFTGHAEVVQVTYDPELISYENLLNVFWRHHDPTTLNRQGEDVGPQYRSVIFYHDRDQREAALESYRKLTQAGAFRDPIVTELQPMRQFFRAEAEHQNYYGGKPSASSRRKRATLTKSNATRATANAKGSATEAEATKSAASSSPGDGQPRP